MNPTARTLDLTPGAAAFPYNSVQRFPLPDNAEERVARTVAAMAAFIHHAAGTGPAVAQLAGKIKNAAGAPLVALWELLKSHQLHEEDPPGTELLRHPEQSALAITAGRRFTGDCDDVATLAAAVAIRLGYDVAIRVVARHGYNWEHVYTLAGRPGGSLRAIDPQENDRPFAERSFERHLDFPVWSAPR